MSNLWAEYEKINYKFYQEKPQIRKTAGQI